MHIAQELRLPGRVRANQEDEPGTVKFAEFRQYNAFQWFEVRNLFHRTPRRNTPKDRT
jgi:hypothetical protein